MKTVPQRTKTAILWFVIPLGITSCATAPDASLQPQDAVASLASREMPGRLDEVVEGLQLSSTSIQLPKPAERSAPDQRGFWFVRALAWSPEVRAARSDLRTAVALAQGAGAPDPIAFQAVDHELGGDDDLVEAIGVLDLIGLMGLGPSGAEKERATAEIALAAARLERVAFDAWIRVESSRLRVIAARARAEQFAALREDAATDLERVRILEDHDRLGAAPAAQARAGVARVERLQAQAEVELHRARWELAQAAGVVVVDREFPSAVMAVGALGEDELRVDVAPGWEQPWPDHAERLIEGHPVLREARVAFAVREAEVREAAARSWPGVGLGPHLGYQDSASIGTVLRLTVPFPSSWKGELEAAVERRDRSIQIFEERLADLLTRDASARAQLATQLAMAKSETGATVRAMGPALQQWSAARSLFRAGRGPLGDWTKALSQLTQTIPWAIDDAEAIELAKLDLCAANGPAWSPFGPLYYDDAQVGAATKVTP